MNSLIEQVTPARVGAVLTAAAVALLPYVDDFKGLDVAVQVAVIASIALIGITFIVCYSRYITQKRTTEIAIGASAPKPKGK